MVSNTSKNNNTTLQPRLKKRINDLILVSVNPATINIFLSESPAKNEESSLSIWNYVQELLRKQQALKRPDKLKIQNLYFLSSYLEKRFNISNEPLPQAIQKPIKPEQIRDEKLELLHILIKDRLSELKEMTPEKPHLKNSNKRPNNDVLPTKTIKKELSLEELFKLARKPTKLTKLNKPITKDSKDLITSFTDVKKPKKTIKKTQPVEPVLNVKNNSKQIKADINKLLTQAKKPAKFKSPSLNDAKMSKPKTTKTTKTVTKKVLATNNKTTINKKNKALSSQTTRQPKVSNKLQTKVKIIVDEPLPSKKPKDLEVDLELLPELSEQPKLKDLAKIKINDLTLKPVDANVIKKIRTYAKYWEEQNLIAKVFRYGRQLNIIDSILIKNAVKSLKTVDTIDDKQIELAKLIKDKRSNSSKLIHMANIDLSKLNNLPELEEKKLNNLENTLDLDYDNKTKILGAVVETIQNYEIVEFDDESLNVPNKGRKYDKKKQRSIDLFKKYKLVINKKIPIE